MTLNSIIKRIQDISLAHKQVRRFYAGEPTDFLTDRKNSYPAILLQDSPGVIDLIGKTVTVGYKMYLVDLANNTDRAKENELDVQSDMLSIAMDLLAEMNFSSYTDWKVSASNGTTLLIEQFDDLVAGVMVEMSIIIPWDQNLCWVPTDQLPGLITVQVDKPVYDLKYVAAGNEVNTLTPPELNGKKILLIIRENAPLFKVSSNPDPAEFIWNDVDIVLGTPVSMAGERFLILYREY